MGLGWGGEFCFYVNQWKQNPREAATLTAECGQLPLLQFLCHPFPLWSWGTAQQILLVLTWGGGVSHPLLLVLKKKMG